MTIEEFIKKHNPNNGTNPWYEYNESIITPKYEIFESIPSHEMCMSDLVSKNENIKIPTLVELIPTVVSPIHYMIERFHYISIWYSSIIIYPGALMDSDISFMINELYRNNLLAPNILQCITIAHDYTTARFYDNEIEYNDYLQFMERINKANHGRF